MFSSAGGAPDEDTRGSSPGGGVVGGRGGLRPVGARLVGGDAQAPARDLHARFQRAGRPLRDAGQAADPQRLLRVLRQPRATSPSSSACWRPSRPSAASAELAADGSADALTSSSVTAATTTTSTAGTSGHRACARRSPAAAPSTAPAWANSAGSSSRPSHLLHSFRRLRTRWKVREDIHHAFLSIGRRRLTSLCWFVSEGSCRDDMIINWTHHVWPAYSRDPAGIQRGKTGGDLPDE